METDIISAADLTAHFTGWELLVLMEAARISLGDAQIFDEIAERMDISDQEMTQLVDTLNLFIAERAPL